MSEPVEMILKKVQLPFVGSLHEFQREDINNLAPLTNSGWFLDLGLGKTVCAALTGCWKLEYEDYYSCLVLCPETLVHQWVSTLDKMGVAVLDYRGTPAKRKKMSLDYDFVVMSYQIFQRDYDRFTKEKHFVIVDEATIMCNSQNLLWKMLQGGMTVKKVKIPGKLKPELQKTIYKKVNQGCALLTATPINKPEDAYGLIKVLTPDVYKNYSQFLRLHVEKEDYFGNPSEYKDLDVLGENLLLQATQRYATDHLSLPPVVFNVVEYALTPEHYKLYKKLVEERVLEHEGGEVFDSLSAQEIYNWAQRLIFNPDLLGYTKPITGLDLLDTILGAVKSFVMFNNYKATNAKMMERYSIGACFSEVTSKAKAEYIEQFKAGELKGLTVNPKSGGFGLDLPMCQNVIMGELPITPRDFYQCVGRCHRQGQKKSVIVTSLVAVGTIQETLYKRIKEKDDLMKEVINTPRSLREDLGRKKSAGEILEELLGKSS